MTNLNADGTTAGIRADTDRAFVPIDEVNASWRHRSTASGNSLNSRSVPSGVLAWFGPPTSRCRRIASTVGAGGPLPAPSERGAPTALLPSFFALQALTNQFRADGPLPIAIANIALSVPRASSPRARAAAAKGEALNPSPASSKQSSRRAFMVAGLMHDQWGVPAGPGVAS
jgi:hypothetical protein